jgi:ABC-type multidrug transport system ATPase subunit
MVESPVTAAAAAPVWRLRDVAAGFAEAEGRLEGLNLEIRQGEQVALLGSETSGKTLLFRVLACLRPYRSGSFELFGQELPLLPYFADWDQILSNSLRRRLGVLLERDGLLSNVTVREGLELLFRFKNGDHTAKHREGARLMVQKIGERFGIQDTLEKRPYLLTAAQRRLAGMARAFLSKPSVVLLENPSLGFGDLERERLGTALDFIHANASRTMIISTDDVRLALRYCPRWIVMENGRIVFDGPAAEFLASKHPIAGCYQRALAPQEVAA